MPVVAVEQVSVTYGQGNRVLAAERNVDLRVSAGEIVGLVGPSGCGKSTLLRVLAAIERPTSGEVSYGGTAVWRHGRRELPRPAFVTAIFQDPTQSLDPRWPIWRSVTEPLTAGERMNKSERRKRAIDALSGVGLGDLDLDAKPAELSGGQCQRVCIVRALLKCPALLVADEPTASLDVTNAAGIVHLLRRAADEGAAIVLVSHDETLVGVVADSVATMSNGSLISQDGDRRGSN